MKIKLSNKTKETFRWYNFMVAVWFLSFAYSAYYLMICGITWVTTGNFYLNLHDWWSILFIPASLITISPMILGLSMDIKYWIKSHYKNGVLMI